MAKRGNGEGNRESGQIRLGEEQDSVQSPGAIPDEPIGEKSAAAAALTDAVLFLQQLIRLDSSNPPGKEGEAARFLASHLQAAGLEVRLLPVAGDRCNVEARLRGGRREADVERVAEPAGAGAGTQAGDGLAATEANAARLGERFAATEAGLAPVEKERPRLARSAPKTLLFCGHMDTVTPGDPGAWTYPPHAGVIADNRLYGRGASDMKSGLAAMVLAIVELAQEQVALDGDLLLLLTVGEEVDCIGARHYMEQTGICEIDALVIGEPTNNRIAVGHKGAMWVEIATQGVTAHASMPERGINAIDHMLALLAAIRSAEAHPLQVHPVLGPSTLTLTKLTGGIHTNMIPDRCSAELDIRTVPPQKHTELLERLIGQLQETSERLPELQFELNLLLDRAPLWTEPDEAFIRLAQTILQELAKESVTEASARKNVACADSKDEEAGEAGHLDSPSSPTSLTIGDALQTVCGVSFFTDGSILNPDNRIPTLLFGPGDDQMAHKPNEYVDLEQYRQAIRFYKQLAQAYLGKPSLGHAQSHFHV
jgi:succinyl-diaminopimelate desuccinylase